MRFAFDDVKHEKIAIVDDIVGMWRETDMTSAHVRQV